MFGKKANAERERFYLLPGQGGSAYRRKQRKLLAWSVVAALVFSGALAALMYWLDRGPS